MSSREFSVSKEAHFCSFPRSLDLTNSLKEEEGVMTREKILFTGGKAATHGMRNHQIETNKGYLVSVCAGDLI
jgi:hypothetical protein